MRDITHSVLARKAASKLKRPLFTTKKFIASFAFSLAIIGMGTAIAFNSGGTPGGTGTDTIAWTGQGASNGALNTSLCDAENDPNGANQPYLLWVFTTDGGSATITGSQGLTLGGNGTGSYLPDTSTGNTFKFVTPYYTPDSSLTATASFTVVATGSGAWNLVISHGCVGKASPTIATTPNPTTATIGDTLNDTATLSGGNSPTGSVTFSLYSPSDPNCTGTPAYTEADSTAPYATTTGYAGNVVGTWHWTAHYEGDTNNNPADSLCTDETVTVNKAQLGIHTTVHSDSPDQALTGNLNLGDGAHDSAAVTGGVSGFALPDVTFYFFPNGISCTNGDTTGATALNTMTPDSSGVAHPSTSETALAAGTYNFMAVVAGNANYVGATSDCEPFTVNKAQLGITTDIHDVNHNIVTTIVEGNTVHDTATVTGSVSGFTLPSVTFTFYANGTCANTGTTVTTTGTDEGNTAAVRSAASAALTPGSYSYSATVASNDNYIGATATCEPLTVTQVLYWCSPGFWATALKQHRTGVLDYLYDNTSPHLDLTLVHYNSISGAPLSKKTSGQNPTLAQVLASPNTYGGPAFNSVADYIAAQLGWNGTQLTGENCPIDAHGNLTVTTLTL
jgi:hypothetical protein